MLNYRLPEDKINGEHLVKTEQHNVEFILKGFEFLKNKKFNIIITIIIGALSDLIKT